MLDPFEIRVLAVLAEKEGLTPDNYPLSLNALTNGCNQLSSRDPVMQLSEDTVADVLARLTEKKLVNSVNQSGSRVTKYEHRMRIKWSLEQDKVAIMAILMLRGLQTAGEIRTRSGRLHEFKSVGEVETGLQFLMDKYPPLVASVQAPGTREPRYGQLLGGEDSLAREATASAYGGAASAAGGATGGGGASGAGRGAADSERVAALEREVQALRAEMSALTAAFIAFKRSFE
ncbi:YceH family protein [Pseudoduganella sp. UC29_106]|uniref:YceH family protein n=1 Tax=Pseudoduganella sp. UC29_106 TaxID=3374553 RepID=UPI003758429F